jgi:hypothetical protein
LQTLYKNKDIDEVHVWNFTKELCDEEYIKQYLTDVDSKKIYNGETIDFVDGMIIDKYRLNLVNESLVVSYISNISETLNQSLQIVDKASIKIDVVKNINQSYFTISYDTHATNIFTTLIMSIDYMVVKYPDWKLFNVDNKKSWAEYYSYYGNQKQFKGDDVIIKCDDDIVFIDTLRFKTFIDRRIKNQNYLLFAPNIVNNGVTAYHQSKMNLIPMDMPYDTFFGKLVNDGKLANEIHTHFCQNTIAYLTKSRNTSTIIDHKIGDRFSINFFAILAKHLFVYKDVGWDDEYDITVTIPMMYNTGIGIDMSMTVSHLGFAPQRKSGLDEVLLIDIYKKLADTTLCALIPRIEMLDLKSKKQIL